MMLGDASLRILASRPLYVFGGAAQFIVYTRDIGVAPGPFAGLRRQNALLKLQTESRQLRALFRTGMSYHVLSAEELVGTK
jgi:hypothetical protein